jgi:hypothetical protein
MDFSTIKFFKLSEFDSPDLPGSGANMQFDVVVELDLMRGELGLPLIVNSGYRTKVHNDVIHGEPNSAHLRGWAVDLQANTKMFRSQIVRQAILHGFRRIGMAETFVHLDKDPSLPAPVLWMYGPVTRQHPDGIF